MAVGRHAGGLRDAGERVIDESAAPATGPAQMAGVARPWEVAAAGAHAGRQVVMQTGIVLDRHTPALERLIGLVRWGLGGRVGNGPQWVSWIHVTDFLAVVETLLQMSSWTASYMSRARALSAMRS